MGFLKPSGPFSNVRDYKFKCFSILIEQNSILLWTEIKRKVTPIFRYYKPEKYQEFRPLLYFATFKNPNIAKMLQFIFIRYYSLTFTHLHLRTIPDTHDWKWVIYKWVISFRYLTLFCNKIVCTTIVDWIHTIICYRLDKYKSIHKLEVPSTVVSYVHFIKTFFSYEIYLHVSLSEYAKTE